MKNRSDMVWGIISIVVGVCLLLLHVFPQIADFFAWPFPIIGVGLIFLLAAILSRTGGLAIPACIIGGIGGILYYQNLTGAWDSWAYLWTLIPGFVGVGTLLRGLIDRSGPKFERSGLVLIAISLIGFLIVGSRWRFGWRGGIYASIVLIVIGAILLISSSSKSKKKDEQKEE